MKLLVLVALASCTLWGADSKRVLLKRQPPPQPEVAANITPVMLPAPALDKTTAAALDVSRVLLNTLTPPSKTEDGSIQYEYGRSGTPVIICATLHVCIVELESGEKIINAAYGDDTRWEVKHQFYGIGDEATPVVVVRPKDPDVSTTIAVMTTRRAYYLRLVSGAEGSEYTGRVTFRYRDTEKREAVEQQQAILRISEVPKVAPVVLPADALNFRYHVSGGRAWMRPVRVYDDTAKTYVTMPVATSHRELPVLIVLDESGKQVMSNSRYQPETNTFVLDRIANKMELRLGSGKKVQRVTITKEGKS